MAPWNGPNNLNMFVSSIESYLSLNSECCLSPSLGRGSTTVILWIANSKIHFYIIITISLLGFAAVESPLKAGGS